MRTTEITEEISVAKMVARNQWETYDILGLYLKNNGYKIIGRGGCSATYAKENETFVIKVAFYSDRPWLIFVETVHANKTNPHFPKISRVRRYAAEDGYTFIALVERLVPITTITPDVHFLAAYMMKLIQSIPGEKFISSRIKQNHILSWNEYTKTITPNDATQEECEELLTNLSAEFERKYPRFVKTIHTVIDNAGKYYLDLHDENIMVRPQGNAFVIIDPYSQ